MSTVLDRDYRRKPCPICGNVGSIQIEYSTSVFYCVQCGARAFDPWDDQPKKEPKPKKKEPVVPDPRPPLPASPSIRDVVEDFYVPHDKELNDVLTPSGKRERFLVSKVFCPKADTDDSEFDPNTPKAQFYLRLHAKRFKNRRRYDRDIKRRRGGLPSTRSTENVCTTVS